MSDFWVFKTDSRGRLVWTRTLDSTNGTSYEEAHCVIQAHDS